MIKVLTDLVPGENPLPGWVLTWQRRKERELCLSSSSLRTLVSSWGITSWPHIHLITFQSPHFKILSQWSVKAATWVWGTYKHSVCNWPQVHSEVWLEEHENFFRTYKIRMKTQSWPEDFILLLVIPVVHSSVLWNHSDNLRTKPFKELKCILFLGCLLFPL